MRIKFGYELTYSCPQPTPMILMLHVHPSLIHQLIKPDDIRLTPNVPAALYHDGYGNTCTRIEAPAGDIRISTDGILADSGVPEPEFPYVQEQPVSLLPEDTLQYLLGSRFCETEALLADAWRLFGATAPGWSRVQAVCDFAHHHVSSGYQFARPTRTAWDAYSDHQGISRDIVHLAITLCRCLNIPARYCTGYLGEIGTTRASEPSTDFATWFEAYLGGAWRTFDPRSNQRRIGRILMARGRDAADVAIATTFGQNRLTSLRVWTHEVAETSAQTRHAHRSAYLDERFGRLSTVE
jgi:transglutaminase-like putative cysteine protease